MKNSENQRVGLRQPLQERSRYKVQLMLEAALRLLETKGLEGLTTNGIAASAGVSIGTLYQFFSNKEAILDTLADREVASMSARVLQVMEDAGISSPEERVAAVVRAVSESYGGRGEAHRLVMAHSLAQGGGRLSPLLSKLMTHLSNERQVGPIRQAMSRGDAFVLAHAFAGVLRAMISQARNAPPREEIVQALARLVAGFIR
jgi:AcrR family transcriptional regulator